MGVFANFLNDRGGRYGLVIMFAAFMIQFMSFGISGSIGIYNVEFLDRFDTTAAAVSLIGAINIGVFLGAGPIASYLMNKFGYRQIALVGSVLSTFGLICVPFAPTMPALYVFYGLFTGLGYCLAYIPSHVMSGLYFEKHRSLATGVVTSGSGLGAVFFPILTQYLIEEYGWQGSFFIIAGLSLQNCVFAALLTPLPETVKAENGSAYEQEPMLENTKTKTEEESESKGNESITQKEIHSTNVANFRQVHEKTWRDRHCDILCNFRFIIYFINNLLWNMGVSIIMVFGAEYFTTKGQSKTSAAELVMLYGLGTFFGGIISGALGNVKHLKRIWIYNLSTVAVGLVALMFPIEMVHTYAGFAVLSFSWGCWFGMILGLLVVVLADILTVHALGDGMGYLMFANGAGCLTGPPIAGLLSDIYGNFDLAFYLSGILTVLSGLMMVAIPLQSRCQSPQQQQTDTQISHINESDEKTKFDDEGNI